MLSKCNQDMDIVVFDEFDEEERPYEISEVVVDPYEGGELQHILVKATRF